MDSGLIFEQFDGAARGIRGAVEVFPQADLIVGVHGAGLANTIFCELFFLVGHRPAVPVRGCRTAAGFLTRTGQLCVCVGFPGRHLPLLLASNSSSEFTTRGKFASVHAPLARPARARVLFQRQSNGGVTHPAAGRRRRPTVGLLPCSGGARCHGDDRRSAPALFPASPPGAFSAIT
mmetsp:Transcript_63512/g.175096  ORF Transcript_63512/g.175096 Transcript_63512/m.175096 type:complete len:177 (+) Transcript_63512:1382-1912(+)